MPVLRRAHGTARREEETVTSGQAVGQGRIAVDGRNQDGVLTVTIRGEVDVATAPVLCGYLDRALQEQPRLLVFDLAGVEFIDCAAVAAIRACRATPGRPGLVLRHPRPHVRRMLSLTGLDVQCAVQP
jgi:anti-sigma B factor antagonist